jgi:hypothetical protein
MRLPEPFLGLVAASKRQPGATPQTRMRGASAIASSRVADSSAAFISV